MPEEGDICLLPQLDSLTCLLRMSVVLFTHPFLLVLRRRLGVDQQDSISDEELEVTEITCRDFVVWPA
jgi:hypothetical protein